MNEAVKCQPEIKHHKVHLIILIAGTLVCLVPLFAMFYRDESSRSILFVIAGMFALFTGPLIFHHAYQWAYYLHLKPTNIQEVTLEKVQASIFRYMSFYFDMSINGRVMRVSTLAIFNPGLIGIKLIDNYSARRALVGYDEKKAIAVILKLY